MLRTLNIAAPSAITLNASRCFGVKGGIAIRQFASSSDRRQDKRLPSFSNVRAAKHDHYMYDNGKSLDFFIMPFY